jgi:TonB family protein
MRGLSVRKIIVLTGFLALIPAAQAQMGPSDARAISRPMPSKAPSGVQTFAAEAELIVSRKGRVDFVEVVTSSGDPAFDKEWKKSLSDWRYVPAVGADGQPVESHSHVTYKNTGISERPSSPTGATPANPVADSERLDRLTCKDFLWEYYIVTNTLPRRLALMDPLLKTPLLAFNAEARTEPAQQQALRERYDEIVNEAAKQCRDNPDTVFWPGVLKPLLQAALVN